ncbi:MAG: YdhR family protein [Kiloniellaceae bacterium]
MITAFIQFTLPAGTTREAVMAAFRASVEQLRGTPGLIRKHYLYNAEAGTAAGLYLWESRAAAEALYTDDWRKMITARYGSAPVIAWFDTPILLDNLTGEVVEDAAD